MNGHSHTFTPSGTISTTTNLTGRYQQVIRGVLTVGYNYNGDGGDNDYGKTEGIFSFGDPFFINQAEWRPYHQGSTDANHIKSLAINANHNHSFTGNTSNTSSATSTCSSVTTTGKFSGTQDTTSSSGSGTSFSIMPPYIVKYCWERTA